MFNNEGEVAACVTQEEREAKFAMATPAEGRKDARKPADDGPESKGGLGAAVSAQPGSAATDAVIDRVGRLSLMLAQGRHNQVVEESLRRLRISPDSLFSVESLMRAQWRAGHVPEALKWARRALRLNPQEPGYRLMQGLLRQSVGMLADAMDDFEAALRLARSSRLREKALEALHVLENWQFSVIMALLREDRMFRLAFVCDSVGAVRERGFRLTSDGEKALDALGTSVLADMDVPQSVGRS